MNGQARCLSKPYARALIDAFLCEFLWSDYGLTFVGTLSKIAWSLNETIKFSTKNKLTPQQHLKPTYSMLLFSCTPLLQLMLTLEPRIIEHHSRISVSENSTVYNYNSRLLSFDSKLFFIEFIFNSQAYRYYQLVCFFLYNKTH